MENFQPLWKTLWKTFNVCGKQCGKVRWDVDNKKHHLSMMFVDDAIIGILEEILHEIKRIMRDYHPRLYINRF